MSERCLRRMQFSVLLAVAVSSLHGVNASSVLKRERTILIAKEGRGYRLIRPDEIPDDPVPPLIEGSPELFQGRLNKSAADKIMDAYLRLMVEVYAREYGFSDGLRAFLEKEETARQVFIGALNFRYDEIRQAARIFDELLSEDPGLLLKYVHLATALAVVHDTPDAVHTSRQFTIWGISTEQFGQPLDYKAVWKYYTDRGNARHFAFSMDKLPWSVLVHLVDIDLPLQDIAWARSNYHGRTDITPLYKSVPYDYDKAGETSNLGNRPYSLPNIRTYGGVCGDQAQFTTRVAKCLGVPAMKVGGESRYGGSGHSWAGYLVVQGGRPSLEFTGRYFYDYYYTGDVFDPQTRTLTLDRYIAMMYDGAAASFDDYNRSLLLTRLAEAMEQSHPEQSLKLVQYALKMNYFNMWAWPLLMRHVKSGTLKPKDGLKWFNDALRVLRDHPDITFECLLTFRECVPKTNVRKRQSLYEQAFRVYKDRPDLQLKLRMAQARELVEADMKLPALNVLAATVVSNAGEGALVMPAMKAAVDIAREFGLQRQAYAVLRKADSAFPKKRGNRVSEAYTEFREVLESLRQ